MTRHIVATVEDIPAGHRQRVMLNGRPIVIFNLAGEFYGLFDRCPHQGARLSDGHLTGLLEAASPGDYRYSRQGEILRCPWHAWEFDIRTGKSYCDPARVRTRAYPVTVAAGAALVEGPYQAETLRVSVEQDYVVVDI